MTHTPITMKSTAKNSIWNGYQTRQLTRKRVRVYVPTPIARVDSEANSFLEQDR